MSPATAVLLGIYRRHLKAAQAKDNPLRERLYRLIEDYEWAFPEAKAEVDAIYPMKEKTDDA